MITSDDQQLLRAIQREVPLTARPFAQIAAELGRTEEWVLQRVLALRDGGVIREISGIFDAPALGYQQALVAMELPQARLDDAGQIVARHSGVSHCYGRRGGKYNLWFTLAVSPQSTLGLERTVERLSELCGACAHLILPTLKRYKLKVEFFRDTSSGTNQPGGVQNPAYGGNPDGSPLRYDLHTLQEEQVRAMRALLIDLPCCSEPFATLASDAGMAVERLLSIATNLLARGLMRRYAAVLHHRAAGAEANVMVAWRVSPAAADAAGARCAAVAAVSHCYLRPTGSDWLYNLYTMIHGRSRADCELAIDEIAAVTGLGERCELWTDREYKKQRVRLLDEREREWESDVSRASRPRVSRSS